MTRAYLKIRQLFNRVGAPEAPASREWNRLSPGLGDGLLPNLGVEAFSLLRTMFVPKYYADQAGLKGLNSDQMFLHFLQEGLQRNISPTPLFQTKVVDRLIPPQIGKTKEPAILRWLRHPARSSIVPTVRFDADYYRAWHPDVAEENFPPFEHYLRFGLAEGRSPNAIFDRLWYEETIASNWEAKSLPSYIHYLCEGVHQGVAPRHILYPTFMHRVPGSQVSLDQFDELVVSSQPWLAKYGVHKYIILIALFLSYAYDGDGALSSDADGIARLVHFLNVGARAGLDPGPMFNSDYYLRQLGSGNLLPKLNSAPLLHFLAEGIHKRIVPTPLFDAASYCRVHMDIAQSNIWGFEHFIVFGVFEGRSGENAQRIAVRFRPEKRKEGAVGNWQAFWSLYDERVPQTILPKSVSALQRKVTSILNSEEFAGIMKRALEIEPGLGDFRDIHEILVPPLHDPREQVRVELQARLSVKPYHTIIAVPWLRNGGADLVACLLAKAISAIRPGENILLLRTDNPHFERPDWIPPGIDTVDISDIMNALPVMEREFLLYTAFLGVHPACIVNVNSRLCWTTFRRFGRRLRPHMKLYSYLFCWDQTSSGMRAGYPSEFFPDTAGILDGVFTDTEYMRDELIRIYRVPLDVQRRLHTLYSPTQSAAAQDVAARTAATVSMGRQRPMILWGGRLDRQKRFDLVQEIAKKMPVADFFCWGAAVLDASPDLSNSPPNLILSREFKGFDDLPLGAADLWLYTSAWDGMPTTLIELGKRGMSIVASAVGGVPELIDETTGWPVFAFDTVDAYVDAIQQALFQPQERIKRAESLKQRVAERFTEANYAQKLAEIIFTEEIQ